MRSMRILGSTLLLCAMVSIVTSSCSTPTQPPGTDAEIHPLQSYAIGKFSLFPCDTSVNGAFGTVVMECLDGGSWTLPDRVCTDDLAFNMASLIGISLCGFTTLLVVFIVFATRNLTKQSKAYEDSSTEVASQNEAARAPRA